MSIKERSFEVKRLVKSIQVDDPLASIPRDISQKDLFVSIFFLNRTETSTVTNIEHQGLIKFLSMHQVHGCENVFSIRALHSSLGTTLVSIRLGYPVEASGMSRRFGIDLFPYLEHSVSPSRYNVIVR